MTEDVRVRIDSRENRKMMEESNVIVLSKEGEKVVLKVCMFVHNNFKHDSRVLREAKTLVEAGYDVRVIAILDNDTEPYEKRDGFRIIRVARDTIRNKALRITSVIFLPYQKVLEVTRVILLPFYWILNFLSRSLGILTHKLTKRQLAPSKINKATKKLKRAFYSKINKAAKKLKKILYSNIERILKLFYKPLTILDYAYHVVELLTKEPADIYHAHDLNTLLAGYWAKRKMGGKLIYDSHELYTERNTLKKQSKITKFLVSKTESFLVKSANDVITVNDSIGRELRRRYYIKRLTIITNTPSYRVKKHFLSLHEELGIPEGDKIVLYSGNITFNRGLEELIQSLLYLENCTLVLMGHSSNHAYAANLKQFVGDVGLEDKVCFFGPVPYEKVTEYAASADVGAAPIKNVCLSYYYCSPNKLFEYIAGGIPTVASDFPELKKVVEERKLGMTFNPNDPKDISEAINYVLSDKDRYEQMRRNALKAAKVLNWENESKKLLEIYRRLEDEINITSN